MCGIVGAVAQRNVEGILLEGLKRLEYRGYDSAGMAVLAADGSLHAAARWARWRRWRSAWSLSCRRAQRDRPHPLGDPRSSQRGECPSPPVR